MKKKFLGLSDDGFRVYTMWTPGEKGDCGIVMTIGYRDDEFMVYESEPWANQQEQEIERIALSAADEMRNLQTMMMSSVTFGYGARGFGKRSIGQLDQITKGSFADLEARAKRSHSKSLMFIDEYKARNPKITVTPDQQGQPKRKPQPNRGPRGRKDWK
ncbi:hypothetical protein HWB52_gp47 [Pseudomonas phage Littlefix]|uniref:Uncharacterized protein n=1 Tax=Pseudomonas phage Littlefix TaxID=2079289 RepID=A0A2K9VHV3_9CAUD|nr:hypothetical protein HWB52_gp47 [Pseudomonas phage Littlefix]AUV61862.1 hypothetical protein PsPhLittlefix_gp47 [Pseudomonas phage Littlefix]